MARFDVFKTADGAYVIDYQADILAYLQTRLVIPLLPPELEPKVSERLNPAFMIGDHRYVLYPQFAASVSANELRDFVVSFSDHHYVIVDAFDMLTSGY